MGLLLRWVLEIYENINVREKEVWDVGWWILFPGIIHICWVGSLIFESVTQWGISLKMWVCSIGLWITMETMVVEIIQGKHTTWEGDQCYNGTQPRVIETWDYKRDVQEMTNMSGYRKVLKLGKKMTTVFLAVFSTWFKIFQDALVFDITIITIDWISRHLYFVLKESQNGMQIFDVDLEHKVKYPRKLKICNRNSTIISFFVYPLLRYLKCTCFYCTEIQRHI